MLFDLIIAKSVEGVITSFNFATISSFVTEEGKEPSFRFLGKSNPSNDSLLEVKTSFKRIVSVLNPWECLVIISELLFSNCSLIECICTL